MISSNLINGRYSLNDLIPTDSLCRVIEEFSLSVGISFDFFCFIENSPLILSPEEFNKNYSSLVSTLSDNPDARVLPFGNDGSVIGFLPLFFKSNYIGNIFTGKIHFDNEEKTLPKRLMHSLIFLKNDLLNRIEKSLRESEISIHKSEALDREIFLNRIIDQSPFAIWVSDDKGTMIRCNKMLTDFLGLDPEALIGKYNIFQDPVIKEHDLVNEVSSVFEQGKSIQLELNWKGFQNETVDLSSAHNLYLMATIFPIYDSNNRITNGVCQWLDITQRKRAEEELNRYKTQLESLVEERTRTLKEEIENREKTENELRRTQTIFDAFLENNPIYVFFKDRNIRTLKLSRNYEQMLGLPLNQVIGKTMDELFPSDLAKKMVEDDKRILREEKLFYVEEEMDGKFFETIKFPIYIDGKAEILAGFTMDITRRKEAEQRLLQSQKLESLGQLAGGVAHNFNNMLTGIMGSAELLLNNLQGDDRNRELISIIIESSEKAADLARKLLAYSRPREEGEMTILPVHDILKQTQVLLNNTIDKRISLEMDIQAKSDRILGDGAQLQSVLINLGINGAQAIGKAGKILFRTTNRTLSEQECKLSSFHLVPGSYLCIEVIDDGPGIDPRYLDRIFDPFFTTKEYGKGTGLGLSTAFGAIKNHKGSIEVQSRPNLGCTFILLLPLINSN